jgi:spectinomycin phosphotransferase/16S rRNA (guanine(1405)-N(7))-methyltransferase
VFVRSPSLTDAQLAAALRDGWGLHTTALTYRPVGFGSHHWDAREPDGSTWFVTVDDLVAKERGSDASTDAVYARLLAALSTARALRDEALDFVVAPVPARDGTVVRRLSDRFAVAVYEYLDGETRAGEYEHDERSAVLDLVVMVHAAPETVRAVALVDDFTLPDRPDLDAALAGLDEPWPGGPFAEPARDLLARHAPFLTRALGFHDRLTTTARARRDRLVLTHGEPHTENVLRTPDGLHLIDWDTTLVAPPERDLWMIESGDGAVSAWYEAATGRPVLPELLDLYRLRWDLAEVANYVAEFRAPHGDDANTRESWKNLVHSAELEARWPALG